MVTCTFLSFIVIFYSFTATSWHKTAQVSHILQMREPKPWAVKLLVQLAFWVAALDWLQTAGMLLYTGGVSRLCLSAAGPPIDVLDLQSRPQSPPLSSMVRSGLEILGKPHFKIDQGCLYAIFNQLCLVIPGQGIKETLFYIFCL